MILSPMTLSFFVKTKLSFLASLKNSSIRIKLVKIAMYSINISLTCLLVNRWLISGHFPLSNLYESLIFLSWSFSTIYSIISFTLRGEAKATLLPTISWSVAPITLLTCAYAFFCVPQKLQKAESLVPALQSNWLIMHVSVMILSYASLILGSLFAFTLLLVIHFQWINFSIKRFSEPSTTTTTSEARRCKTQFYCVNLPRRQNVEAGPTNEARSPTSFPSVPFSLQTKGKLVEGQQNVSSLVIDEKQNLANQINNNNFLDNLSYRFIGLGFALLTLGIISGAVWANSAWGSYWSWDPKETWAFITWLTYAIYLHLRISKGWYGKQSANVAVFGFFVIWFCYLGVNLFGKGLHSYAFV